MDGFSKYDCKQATNIVKMILGKSDLLNAHKLTTPSDVDIDHWAAGNTGFRNSPSGNNLNY